MLFIHNSHKLQTISCLKSMPKETQNMCLESNYKDEASIWWSLFLVTSQQASSDDLQLCSYVHNVQKEIMVTPALASLE